MTQQQVLTSWTYYHHHVKSGDIFIDQNLENWKSSHLTEGTVMDPNYTLPPNVALITLEVDEMQH